MVSYLVAQSWQIALLAGMMGLISLALRNRSAHLRYLLWLIVLAKCLVPPFLTVPVAVLPERPVGSFDAVVDVPEDRFTPEPAAFVRDHPKPPVSAPAMPAPRGWIALAWVAGALIFLLWVGGRAVRYTAWLRDRRKPLPLDLQKSVQGLSLGFQFRKWPRIWLVEDISQPFVWGLLRGSVYLPTDFISLSGSDQRRSVLAHELSHIARLDAGANLLQVLVQAVYWFHPFVWWTNRMIRQEREKCCDEMAVAHLRTPPEHYTGAIVDALAAERRSAHPIPSLAIVGSVRDIEERIKTMLRPGKTFRRRPSFVAATVASLIALVTIPTALVLTARGQAQPPTQSADKPAQSPGAAAANGEKPEQPRFAARTFSSKAAFEVFVRETGSDPSRRIGRTPSATALEIPACYIWWVQPSGPVKDWDLLVREISQKNVPGLVLGSATDSDLKHLADLTELRHLDLAGTRITDAGLEHLKGLKSLQWLRLSRTQITDAGLEHLKGLTGSQWLLLSGTLVTDAGLAHLEGLTGLQGLGLDSTKITDAGLEHLKTLTALQLLDLSSTKITDAGLEHLKVLSRLQMLYVSNMPITDAGVGHLKNLTTLQELDLGSTKITDAGLEHLKGLSELQTLYVSDTQITDAGLGHFKDLTKWQWLDLSGTQVTDAGLAHLKGASGLQHLDLGGTRVTDAGLAHLKDLTGLRELWLADIRITDAGLAHLKGIAGLQFLILSGTQTTDAGLAHLKGLTELRRLQMLNTKTADPGLEHLKGLTKLWELRIENTLVTDAGMEHLKGLTGLQWLGVSGSRVTDAGVQQLKQSLPKLTIARGEGPSRTQSADQPARSLSATAGDSEKPEQSRFPARTFNAQTTFDVFEQATPLSEWKWIGRTPSVRPVQIPACWCWWVQNRGAVKDWDLLVREIEQNQVPGLRVEGATDADVKRLAGLTGLRFLGFGGPQFTDRGLADLKDLTGLRFEWLALGGTQVTEAGLSHLTGMTWLQRLDLTGIKLTDMGLEHLKGLTRLERLGVSSTQITDAGLEHLKGLTELQYVGLEPTRMTDATLEHLKDLTGLRTLHCSGSHVTDAGLAHLKGWTRLQELYLDGTQVTDAGLQHLQGLTGLRVLNVYGTRITDAGLRHLKGLTGLERLNLPHQITDAGLEHLNLKGLVRLQSAWLGGKGGKITDAGVEQFKGLTEMLYLVLNDTEITDAGLEHLRGLTRLQSLWLDSTPITGAGLTHLKGLTNLSDLRLGDTRLTDVGLEHLKGLTALQRLNLAGTQVTDAGVQQLKKSLPELAIIR
jgi:Leucine-rich repeat (LRR) protein/beta-lactamase regulating signal transducer with metallopeptidase domain